MVWIMEMEGGRRRELRVGCLGFLKNFFQQFDSFSASVERMTIVGGPSLLHRWGFKGVSPPLSRVW